MHKLISYSILCAMLPVIIGTTHAADFSAKAKNALQKRTVQRRTPPNARKTKNEIQADRNRLFLVGFSFLDESSEYAYLLMAKALTKGASINTSTPDHNNCLHLIALRAQDHDTVPMTKFLLGKGINVNQCNKFGKSPLHIAIEQPNQAVAALIVQDSRTNHELTDSSGATPLMLSCDKVLPFITQQLFTRGARIDSDTLLPAGRKAAIYTLDLLLRTHEIDAKDIQNTIDRLTKETQSPTVNPVTSILTKESIKFLRGALKQPLTLSLSIATKCTEHPSPIEKHSIDIAENARVILLQRARHKKKISGNILSFIRDGEMGKKRFNTQKKQAAQKTAGNE